MPTGRRAVATPADATSDARLVPRAAAIEAAKLGGFGVVGRTSPGARRSPRSPSLRRAARRARGGAGPTGSRCCSRRRSCRRRRGRRPPRRDPLHRRRRTGPTSRAGRSVERDDVLRGHDERVPLEHRPVVEERERVRRRRARRGPAPRRRRSGRRGSRPRPSVGYSGDAYGRCRGWRELALVDHQLALEVADLFAALVEAERLDVDDAAVGLARATPSSRAPCVSA